MAATGDLTPESQFLEEQFKQAWKLFKQGSHDEANSLSQWLLQEPSLSDLHKAGVHLILAHSPDEYVFHAKQAVRLYEALYGPGDNPTKNQKKSQDTMIEGARRTLRQCETDEGVIKVHNRLYTQEDLQEDFDEAFDAYVEHRERQEEEADVELAAQVDEAGDVMEGVQASAGTEEYEEEHEDSKPLLPTPPPSRGTEA